MLDIVHELDRQYSPSTVATDAAGSLARYRSRGDDARSRLTVLENLSYGPDPAELADVFPGSPLVAWVHGGHWQEGAKEDGAFAAEAFVDAGYGFAAVGYGLAPARTLPEMTASVRRALHWLAARYGPVHAAGSSAGGHLVAMALTGPDPAPVAGACLISGTYDLTVLRETYVNDALGLDEATAAALSPLARLPLAVDDLVVARGSAETPEYARMQSELTAALRALGRPVTELVVAGRDHFDIVFDLADPATELGSAVRAQLARISRGC
jgi:arylformamidase